MADPLGLRRRSVSNLPAIDRGPRREAGLVGFALLTVVLFALASPQFLSGDTLRAISNASNIEITLAAGMAAVIIAGQIDLSVGAVVGVAAYAAGTAFDHGLSPWIALAIAVCSGTLLGAVNGFIVAALRVPAIIATLGTATAFRGLLFIVAPLASGPMISASQMPPGFLSLSAESIFGLPIATVIALTMAAIVGLLLAWTPWGRDLYAIGSNPDQARLVGIKPGRSAFMALTLLGALAGLGGFLYLMRFASVDVRTGTGLEFNVIAAVVVGGVAVVGGSGTVLGAVIGVLILNMLGRGFVLMSIPEFWKTVGTGVAIIAAVAFDAGLSRRGAERLKRHRRVFRQDVEEPKP